MPQVHDLTAACDRDYPPPRRRRAILVVLTINLVIAFGANSTLVVALPAISRDFEATNSQLQWILASYSLFLAAFILLGGQLAERYGTRAIMGFGLLMFLGATMAAAFVTSPDHMVIARCVMGVGGALIMPGTLMTLVQVFPPDRRASAIAIWTSFTGLAGGLGPIVSGTLLARFWPGSVFLILVPLVIASLIGVGVVVPRMPGSIHQRIDLFGTLLSLTGIGLLVYSLINAQHVGWLMPQTLIAIAVALALLALFIAWQRAAKNPLLALDQFSDARFSVGFGMMLMVFVAYYGVLYVSLLWLQTALDYSPLESALALLPYAVVVMALTPVTPKIVNLLGGRRTAVVASGFCALGFGSFLLLDAHSGYYMFGISVTVFSIGMSLIVPLTTSLVMTASAESSRSGGAAAMTNISRDLGNALGVAVFGSLAVTAYHSEIARPDADRAEATYSSPIAALADIRSIMPAETLNQSVAYIQRAYTIGFHWVAVAGAIVSLVALLVATVFLRSKYSASPAVCVNEVKPSMSSPSLDEVPSCKHENKTPIE